jgi:hypothetical protein
LTFISIHFVIICDVLFWRTYETHSALSLKSECDREIADEAIRRNEKESHNTLEEAKRAEEVAECARLIGIPIIA